ncbi:MAG: (d)CMP kinase [Hydrotalea sp.]|nr:(d)CMP kinase [Hydrotalea sp.]
MTEKPVIAANVAIPNIIAIDGLSASGKGTLAKKLAEHFGFAHLDTGKIYRLVALLALQKNRDLVNQSPAESAPIILAAAKHVIDLMQQPAGAGYHQLLKQHEKYLASDDVAAAASVIARQEQLRAMLKSAQQAFGRDPQKKGAVIDGRDIGTVIFPDAPLKFFVVADVAVRASRRFLELQSHGIHASRDVILADLIRRDKMDKERTIAPLKKADDAIELDNSNLSADELFAKALTIIKDKKLYGN